MPAPNNRTLTIGAEEIERYTPRLSFPTGEGRWSVDEIRDRVFHGDFLACLRHLPEQSIDLLFLDPPYNLNKTFGEATFKETSLEDYESWLESWIVPLKPVLKPTASIYVCGDWKSSSAIHRVCHRHFVVRNRITWEREKGRGARANWKNASEDIWFCSASEHYTFNVDQVKLKRRVIAPYRDPSGRPKDWELSQEGSFRLTYPSNLWTDLTVPFWSMPENTEHPTQKPEKLLAKLILASSHPGDLVFDPFLGSGTTAVVARKLGRHFVGVEIHKAFACLALKRLERVETDRQIQGYRDGVFWERNAGSKTKVPVRTGDEPKPKGAVPEGQTPPH